MAGGNQRIVFVPRLKDCFMLSEAFSHLEFAPKAYHLNYWHQIGCLKEKGLLPHPSLKSVKKFLSVCRKVLCNCFHCSDLLHRAIGTPSPATV